jgi:hypothetical protein
MLDILLMLISLPALILACALWTVVGYGSARRLGYGPVGAAMVVFAGGASGVIATIVRDPPNSPGFRFLVDFFWLTWLFAVAVTAIIILVLPRRQHRTFGNRRPGFPFARIGQLLVVFALLLSIVVITGSVRGSMKAPQASAGLALAIGFLLPTARYLQRLGRRADREATSDQYGVERLEHPVLYLRAFKQEGQFFAIRAANEYGTLPKHWHASVSKPDQNVGGTFEEYFADAFKGSIGSLVALGSPEDYVAPEGAARLYAKDSDWMEHVSVLARNAAAIVVEVGASANLRWEFEYIRKEGLHQKLFVITRPSTEGKWLAWAFWRLVWRIQGSPNVSFREFGPSLAPLGYDLSAVDGGPGSVIAFDTEGKALLLTTRAVWPDEFVSPMRDWINERRLTGRSVPATCSRCGRRVYAFPDDAQTARECRDCRYGRPIVRIWKRIASRAYVLIWMVGIIVICGIPAIWPPPKGSFLEQHIGGVLMVPIGAWFGILILVLGRMDDPPPLGEPHAVAIGSADGGTRLVAVEPKPKPGRPETSGN